jgi:hypothetical protein
MIFIKNILNKMNSQIYLKKLVTTIKLRSRKEHVDVV